MSKQADRSWPTTPAHSTLHTAAQHLAELGAAQLLGVQPLRLRNVRGHVAVDEGMGRLGGGRAMQGGASSVMWRE